MNVSIKFSGDAEAKILAAKLRIAEKDFRPEMGKALRAGARPLPEAARRSAIENLPRRNGLNLVVAAARYRLRRISVMEYQVSAEGIKQLQYTNEGYVNHPTYDRPPRTRQSIPKAKGWFNKPMRRGKRKISDELGDAMHQVAKRITT